jgi:hypothetical protein
MTREDRIRALELAFKPEDGQDGTDFDCAVLDALQELRSTWVCQGCLDTGIIRSGSYNGRGSLCICQIRPQSHLR